MLFGQQNVGALGKLSIRMGSLMDTNYDFFFFTSFPIQKFIHSFHNSQLRAKTKLRILYYLRSRKTKCLAVISDEIFRHDNGPYFPKRKEGISEKQKKMFIY